MKLARAVKLNVGPVIPGAAACAVAVSSKVTTTITIGNDRDVEAVLFEFFARIAALLLDMDLGHEPTKVLGIVRQVVEVRRVEVEGLARLVTRSIEDHIDGFASRQCDR